MSAVTLSDLAGQLARRQIADLRGKAKASYILAVEDIRRRGCAAAGVRLAGEEVRTFVGWTFTVRGVY